MLSSKPRRDGVLLMFLLPLWAIGFSACDGSGIDAGPDAGSDDRRDAGTDGGQVVSACDEEGSLQVGATVFDGNINFAFDVVAFDPARSVPGENAIELVLTNTEDNSVITDTLWDIEFEKGEDVFTFDSTFVSAQDDVSRLGPFAFPSSGLWDVTASMSPGLGAAGGTFHATWCIEDAS